MRVTSLLFVFLMICAKHYSQSKAPFVLRIQQKAASKRIHAYLKQDRLIATSGATLHLHYANDPSKPYLLLLHGMGVDAQTNWYRQVAYLSRFYNLLMPDLIYFGKSVTGKEDYSAEFQVRQIREALRQIGVNTEIPVMGFSYGGLVAAMYNQLYPDEVSKLIIIDGPVKFFTMEMVDSILSVSAVPSMSNLIVPQDLRDFKAMSKAVLSRWYPATKGMKLKLMRYYFTPTLRSRQQQLSYLSAHEEQYRAYDYNLESTPTLLIWGARDGVIPLCVGQRLHAAYPSSTRLLILKKAKHDGHFRYAKTINKAVVKFLCN